MLLAEMRIRHKPLILVQDHYEEGPKNSSKPWTEHWGLNTVCTEQASLSGDHTQYSPTQLRSEPQTPSFFQPTSNSPSFQHKERVSLIYLIPERHLCFLSLFLHTTVFEKLNWTFTFCSHQNDSRKSRIWRYYLEWETYFILFGIRKRHWANISICQEHKLTDGILSLFHVWKQIFGCLSLHSTNVFINVFSN